MSSKASAPLGFSADLSFVKEGQTRKEEVLQRLSWADAGLSENRLIWARWSASSWGVLSGFILPWDAWFVAARSAAKAHKR